MVGIIAALLAAMAWAAGAVLYKKFGRNISSFGMNVAKGGINLLLMGVCLLFVGFGDIDMPTFILLGISGLIGIAVGDTFFFEALRNLSAHVLVLLSLLGQVLTVVFAVFFLDEYLTPSIWLGVAMILLGVTFVVYQRLSERTGENSLRGVCYGLVSVLCMSVSIILTKKGLSSVSALEATFIRMLWATCGLLAWGGLTRQLAVWVAPFREVRVMKGFFLLVCFVSFGGFWLFHVGIKYADVVVANTLSSMEPLFVLPLAAIFLKERMTWTAAAGTTVSLGGLILLCIGYR